MAGRTAWAVVALGLVAAAALSGCSVPGANDPADAADEATPPATAKVQRTEIVEMELRRKALGLAPVDTSDIDGVHGSHAR